MAFIKNGSLFEQRSLILKFFLILMLSIMATSCFASEKNSIKSSCSNLSLDKLYSIYEVFDAVQYSGGITTTLAAKQHIKERIVLKKENLQVRELAISNPTYKLKCYSLPKEGNVPGDRWSNFYGFGLERTSVEVLEVYDKGDALGEPSIKFEILGDQLWELYDGWLYKMKPSQKTEIKPI